MPILGMQSLIPIGIQFRSKHVNLENSMEALLEYVLLFIIVQKLFYKKYTEENLAPPESLKGRHCFILYFISFSFLNVNSS